MDMLRCTMPTPPSCASAIAKRDSVTVSMAALINGMLMRIWGVRYVPTSTWEGSTSDFAGMSNTSSKVKPSRNRPFNIIPSP